jgi:hypothetical protein
MQLNSVPSNIQDYLDKFVELPEDITFLDFNDRK